MKFIKEIGKRKYGNQGRESLWVLAECPVCFTNVELRADNFNKGKATQCNKCAKIASGKTTAGKFKILFAEKAKKIHGDLYDYSDSNYITSIKPIEIKCNRCHQIFEQKPTVHLRGHGCGKCAMTASRDISKLELEVLEKLNKFNIDNLFDYSKVKFVNTNTPIIIICNKCSTANTQLIHNHLKGHGCKICSYKEKSKLDIVKGSINFLKNATKIHGVKYNYTNVVYTGIFNKVKIKCNTCNLLFNKTPDKHLHQKSGCPNCVSYGFNISKPAMLYYLKIKNVWKIGITNHNVAKRYNKKDRENITIIKTWDFETGQEAYDYEQSIVTKYKDYRFNGTTPFTDGTKTTECFTEDIYKLDLKIKKESK